MSKRMHHPVEELLGAYAVDALAPHERDEVDDHLAECGRCRNEVTEHLLALSAMTGGGDAPEGVWDRIAAEIDGQDEPVRPLLEFSRRRRFSAAPVLAAAAVIALVVAAGLGTLLVRQDQRLDRLTAQERQQSELAAALVDPGARRLQLESEDRSQSIGAVVLDGGRAYLVAGSLPELGDDQTYQLWAISGGAPRSLGVLGHRPAAVHTFQLDGDAELLAVTVERAGGVDQPTTAPLVRGFMPPAAA